jgi:hypothetical protein
MGDGAAALLAVQQRGPTVWNMCRLLSGIGISPLKNSLSS